jgi:hypothetical protein
MNYDIDELSAQEREAFEALAREQSPPSFLEDRIVEQLKSTGLIRKTSRSGLAKYGQLAAAILVAVALFAAGAWSGSKWSAKGAAAVEEPGYILIVRNANAEAEPRTPQEEIERVKEYSAWARDLGRKGMLLGGEKLKDDGRIIGQMIGATSPTETVTKPVEGGIGGYFLLTATDYNQALAIARTCPHLKHGGSVELRQIDRF